MDTLGTGDQLKLNQFKRQLFNCNSAPLLFHSCETDWDECWNEPCLHGGTCLDGIAHYNCSCPAGFAGTRCQTNVDDCLSDPCMNNGTCEDGIAGYLCICQLGFRGDDCEVDIQVSS